MNNMHESNRRHWDEAAQRWESLRGEGGLWQRCEQLLEEQKIKE